MIKGRVKGESIAAHAFAPAALLSLYSFLFIIIPSNVLARGVNYYFLERMSKYALYIAAISLFIFFDSCSAAKQKNWLSKSEKIKLPEALLLLLPLTPVLQYIIRNNNILSVYDSVIVLAGFTLISALCIFIMPGVLRVSNKTTRAAVTAFLFVLFSMASFSNYYRWFERGTFSKQIALFAGTFLILRVLYQVNKKALLILIFLNFTFNSVAQFLGQNAANASQTNSFEENKLILAVKDKRPVSTPNVYLLVYDAYAHAETMQAYGIDNKLQEDYLQQRKFSLYPHTYSIGSATLETMSKVLNAADDYYGSTRRAASGDGVVQNIFKNLGYQTYGVFYSDYMFRGVGSGYDHSLPSRSEASYLLLSKAILMGEFRFNIDDLGQSREQFIQSKKEIWESISKEKNFIYMHTNIPGHSQNSGNCLPNETDLYQERLTSANMEMRQDVETIIQNNPTAIIIIAGDHGPYLTKNCRETNDVFDISQISRIDVQDRYGTFLAIRWPDNHFSEYDQITVLQDIFPAIFSYMYQDPSILRAKIKPATSEYNSVSGVKIQDGVIYGGSNDGESLFLLKK
ncbi:MAG: hypothetical protein Fur002_05520 [Anaerolineales bacterium]